MTSWMPRRITTRWVVLAIALLLVAPAIVGTAGTLQNQTSVSTESAGSTTLTLVSASPVSSERVDLSPQRWSVSSANAAITQSGEGFEVAPLDTPVVPSVVVTETVGLTINATSTRYLHLDFQCPLGAEVAVAVGSPGWNSATGPAILANLSKYQGLSGGFESSKGIIWVNTGYPFTTVQCSSRPETLVIDLEGALAPFGLRPIIGGLQVKALVQRHLPEGSSLTMLSAVADSSPNSYVEASSQGQEKAILDGYFVLVTPSAGPSVTEHYFPKRTFVSYDMSAAEGARYAIFAVTKENGTTYLFGSYYAFSHSNASSEIGTTVDFIGGIALKTPIEPFATLSSVLAEGQVGIVFVPLNTSSIESLKVVSVQTTWGLLPFGTSGFVTEHVSAAESTLATGFMVSLSTVMPSCLALLLWRRHRQGSESGGREALWIILGALAIRLALAPVTGFIDTDNFAATSSVYFGSGVFGADWVSLPGFLYFEFVSYFPYALLRNLGFGDWTILAHSTFAVENVFVKLPSILADVGTAVILSRLAAVYRPSLKNLLLGLYLFNPLTVYLSGVYGQYDSVFVFLLLGSLYSSFVLHRRILTGVLLGATVLVNPLGLVAWIPVLFVSARHRERSVFVVLFTGAATLAAGMVPLLLQSGSVLQTSFERLLGAFPGDSVVGTTYQFVAFGQAFLSSVGYGLNFRLFLELVGISLGSYFYPIAAAVAFFILTYILLRKWPASPQHELHASALYSLGIVALFQFFFPTTFLQFALWPLALLFCLYVITGSQGHLRLAVLGTLLTGVLYALLVDKPFDRATGVGGELLGNLAVVNALWAMIGLVYSSMCVYLVFSAVRELRMVSKELSTEAASTPK